MVPASSNIAVIGPTGEDPSAVLFADEPAIRHLTKQLRCVETSGYTVDLIRPPAEEGPPIHRLNIQRTDTPLRVALDGDALLIQGSIGHLKRMADDLDGYADCNDLDEPGIHTHIDREWQNVDNSWIAVDSVPLMVAGWVSEA